MCVNSLLSYNSQNIDIGKNFYNTIDQFINSACKHNKENIESAKRLKLGAQITLHLTESTLSSEHNKNILKLRLIWLNLKLVAALKSAKVEPGVVPKSDTSAISDKFRSFRKDLDEDGKYVAASDEHFSPVHNTQHPYIKSIENLESYTIEAIESKLDLSKKNLAEVRKNYIDEVTAHHDKLSKQINSLLFFPTKDRKNKKSAALEKLLSIINADDWMDPATSILLLIDYLSTNKISLTPILAGRCSVVRSIFERFQEKVIHTPALEFNLHSAPLN